MPNPPVPRAGHAPSADEPTPEHLAEGTLISHLLELRDRLLRALVVVGIAFLPCVYYSNDLFTFVARPLLAKLPQGSNLIATGVMSPFTTPFKLSFFAALMLAMPYVIYQLWAFVAPGLYRNERRFAVPLLVSSILLFYIGIAFAYYFVFPVMFEFFARTTPKGVAMMTDINNYLDFVLDDVLLLRAGVRDAGRGGAAGADGRRAHREAEGEPRLRADRHFHPRSASHAARMPSRSARSPIPMYLLYEGGILMARILSRHRSAQAPAKTSDT